MSTLTGSAPAVAGPRAASRPSSARAERVAAAGAALAYAGLVIALLWIGALKFTAYEAQGIRPLLESSPLLRWMYAVWSVPAASRVIGVVEIAAALLLAARPLSARAARAGGLLAVATFAVTLSFFLTAPGVWDAALGFPALGGTGQFLVKDVALFGVALWAAGGAWAADARRPGAA